MQFLNNFGISAASQITISAYGRARLDKYLVVFKGGYSMLVVLPFKRKGDIMKQESRNEDLKPRSIHLPVWLWGLLDKDAKRCKRSATKQLEALLTLCYDPEADIEIDRDRLDSAFHAVSQKRTKVA